MLDPERPNLGITELKYYESTKKYPEADLIKISCPGEGKIYLCCSSTGWTRWTLSSCLIPDAW